MSRAGCLKLGVPQPTPELCFFPWGCPFHCSSLVTGANWSAPLRACSHIPSVTGETKKEKSKPQKGPLTILLVSRAQTWFQVLGKDFMFPSEGEGTMCPFKVQKSDRGRCPSGVLPAFHLEVNCWAEQQAESSSLRGAGRWLLLRTACSQARG